VFESFKSLQKGFKKKRGLKKRKPPNPFTPSLSAQLPSPPHRPNSTPPLPSHSSGPAAQLASPAAQLSPRRPVFPPSLLSFTDSSGPLVRFTPTSGSPLFRHRRVCRPIFPLFCLSPPSCASSRGNRSTGFTLPLHFLLFPLQARPLL
jgi:hypothetical protein